MRRTVPAVLAAVFGGGSALAQPAPTAWTGEQISVLRQWVASSEQDALPALSTAELDAAATPATTARAATALALRLARMHLLGCATPAERAGWQIPDSDRAIDLPARLDQALAGPGLATFFSGLRPQHADYTALRAAYVTERDPSRRATLARNMERWRWLPQSLGSQYLLVNSAAFTVSLTRPGRPDRSWKVIVGKQKSPTPVFAATVTGVTFNPWWDIPANIVRESVGALVRRNPVLARQRGYVWGGGRYRQRPGPGNSLGQMKLAMPNPYNVYLHDTPSKQLFERPVRAFSHGCIRVEKPMEFSSSLLEETHTAAQVDAAVATGRTETVPLHQAIPVYVAYFTAATGSDGMLAYFPDIYGRDGRMGDATNPHRLCAA